jgi:hypothetical protein
MLLTGAGPSGNVRIFPTDQAVLEAGEARKDLPCTVSPNKPVLGFDLRFHSGFDVVVPLKELAGAENLLTILFRVTAAGHQREPHYFTQRIRVPSIDEDAKGDALLQGAFELGEGSYHVDWLMRDRLERVCSSSWDAAAELPPRDKQIELTMAPETVQATDPEQFREEPPVARAHAEPPLNVKLMVNFAPQKARGAALQPADTSALISLLRSIARDPRVGKFSIVAFNLQEQRVMYRQDNADRIDFPALGDALQTLNLGTVDLKRLANKNGETEFLAELIRKESAKDGAAAAPDALVFAGPKALLDENISPDALREVGQLNYPVFYMNYNLAPQAVPWRDAIGNAVHHLKGYEYTISRPRDLWFAVTDLITRVVRSKGGRPAGASSE